MREHVAVTDGPQRGKPIRLEPWQRGVLNAIDRERKTTVSVMGASQIGKTAITVGLAVRAALDGDGVIAASATLESIRDLARRLDAILDASPELAAKFPRPHGRPGEQGNMETAAPRIRLMAGPRRGRQRVSTRLPDGARGPRRRGVALAGARPQRRRKPATARQNALVGLG